MAIRPLALGVMLCAYALSPQAMFAAERIYCAASDAVIDLSLEIGFDKRDPERLYHLRGLAGLKGEEGKSAAQRFQLNSDMVRQYWIDDKDLRFSLRDPQPTRRPALGFSLVIRTERKSPATLRFEGSYRVDVVRYEATGPEAGETMVAHEAPLFCSIKR